MLTEGETAPGFEIQGADGTSIQQYRLADHIGSGAAVLLFYPFDFSPICTGELCEFNDAEFLTFTDDLDLFGLSTDSAYAHREMIRTHGLSFPLLSDHDGRVSDEYGVLLEDLDDHPQVSQRAVFVVDETATIRYAWATDTYGETPDVREVYEAVTDLDSISA